MEKWKSGQSKILESWLVCVCFLFKWDWFIDCWLPVTEERNARIDVIHDWCQHYQTDLDSFSSWIGTFDIVDGWCANLLIVKTMSVDFGGVDTCACVFMCLCVMQINQRKHNGLVKCWWRVMWILMWICGCCCIILWFVLV